MTLFIDASALVAIIRDETEAVELRAVIAEHGERLISGLAMWEAARALGRAFERGAEHGWFEVERYRNAYEMRVVSIGPEEAAEAFRAHARYGKGSRHPARLNMGDCFAYACAKANGAALLFKGNDFTHTDLA